MELYCTTTMATIKKKADKVVGIGKNIYYFLTTVNANLHIKLLHPFSGDSEGLFGSEPMQKSGC